MGISLLIIQHGEKVRSPGDPGLTDLGRRQAEQVATHMEKQHEVASVWSSPYLRAHQTAEPIAEAFDLRIKTDERLRERMNWDGTHQSTLEDFLEEWQRATQDRAYAPTTGDSSNGAAARFIEALHDIEKVSPADSTVVVVAHGGVTVDVLRTLLGDGRVAVANPELIVDGVPCGAITSLTIDNGRIAVSAFPRTAHLAGTSPHRPV